MNQQHEGVVLSVSGNMAQVKASRHSDCENCGSCPGSSAIVVDAQNPVGARPGQRVLVEVRELGMLKSAFVVYMIPLIATFAGAVLGDYLAGWLARDPLWFQVGGAGLAFVGAVLYIRYFDQNASADATMQPVIVRILTE